MMHNNNNNKNNSFYYFLLLKVYTEKPDKWFEAGTECHQEVFDVLSEILQQIMENQKRKMQ
jgi:hypothetical protein